MNRLNRAKESHLNKEYFKTDAYRVEYLKYLNNFIKDDLGENGDITSNIIFPDNYEARALILAKENFIIAGIDELLVFLGESIVEWRVRPDTVANPFLDGDFVNEGRIILSLNGPIKNLLMLERTILNFLQRMSGIATVANRAASKVSGLVLVCPTRKTFWGSLDKKACMMGGAGTHRINLSDAVLVKDNHIKLIDGIQLENLLKSRLPDVSFFEIEVNNSKEVLKYGEFLVELMKEYPNIKGVLMFDNMSPIRIKKCLGELKREGFYNDLLIEASGGITMKNIVNYAKSGVDIVSMGELTHSARAVDISMKIEKS